MTVVWREAQPGPSGWFGFFQRWRVAWITLMFFLLAGLYALSGTPGQRALSVFVLAPLLVGSFGTWTTTMWTGVAAIAVTTATWWMVSPISFQAFAARVVIVAIGGGAAVLGARTRERQRDDAVALRTRLQTAATFGAQLVPTRPPLRHFELAVYYEPGEAGLALGGDFVDAVELADGSVAFIIGDVCGHGPDAAALGVAIRIAWRSTVHLGSPEPAQWLTGLEDTFAVELSERFATAVTGIVRAGGRTAVLSMAGHPFPILLDPRPRMLHTRNDPPLGLRPDHRQRRQVDIEVGGASILLMTDGLWEARRVGGNGTRAEIDDVPAAIAALPPLEDLEGLELLTEQFRPPDGTFDDDVALLLVKPRLSSWPRGTCPP